MAEVNLVICSMLCSTQVFLINGIHADSSDFGEQYDDNPYELTSLSYGCGNMCFFPKPPTNEVLEKYNISVKEYTDITNKLESYLSFGRCSRCV